MLINKTTLHETHYDILGVKEDASYEEIRCKYRFAILNSHSDKLQKTSETFNPEHELGDRFLDVQRAWEILGNSTSLAVELQILRQDAITAENDRLEDLTVEDCGEVVKLFYKCQCGDYFSVDFLELKEMRYTLLRDGSKISLQNTSNLLASFVIPCCSCYLHKCLLINQYKSFPTDDQL